MIGTHQNTKKMSNTDQTKKSNQDDRYTWIGTSWVKNKMINKNKNTKLSEKDWDKNKEKCIISC
jgi:hypothetical protein